jgi:hypothetical protein
MRARSAFWVRPLTSAASAIVKLFTWRCSPAGSATPPRRARGRARASDGRCARAPCLPGSQMVTIAGQ